MGQISEPIKNGQAGWNSGRESGPGGIKQSYGSGNSVRAGSNYSPTSSSSHTGPGSNSGVEPVLPHSKEAEEAVLGSLLIDRDTITLVAPTLKPQHFFGQERALLLQALLNLYAAEIPGDMVTIKNELKTMGVLSEQGGGEGQVRSSYLLRLMQATLLRSMLSTIPILC